MSDIEAVTQSALQSIQASTTLDELDQLRVNLLGKSGSITSQLKQLGALPPEQRKLAGRSGESCQGTAGRSDFSTQTHA